MFFYQEKTSKTNTTLTHGETAAILYHNTFDYPLTYPEIIKWTPGTKASLPQVKIDVESENGYFFKKGRAQIVYKRLIRKRISARKMEIAKKAARVLALLPTICFVGVTGSLAMENAPDGADMDLLIITKKKTLWTTRLISYTVLKFFGLSLRRAGVSNEKNRLCLNIWLDENNLRWPKRNSYTAHEIAQIVPVFDRENYYTRLLLFNRWVKDFWPNAVLVGKKKDIEIMTESRKLIIRFFEVFNTLAFTIQKRYMRKKITIEKISIGKAVFHPVDLSELIYFPIK